MSNHRRRSRILTQLPDLQKPRRTIRKGHKSIRKRTRRHRIRRPARRQSIQQEVLRRNRPILGQRKRTNESHGRRVESPVCRPQVLPARRQRHLVRPVNSGVRALLRQRKRLVSVRQHPRRRINAVLGKLARALQHDPQIVPVRGHLHVPRVIALIGARDVVGVAQRARGGINGMRPQLVFAVVGRVQETRVRADDGAVDARGVVVTEVLDGLDERARGGVDGDDGAAARGLAEVGPVERVGRVVVRDLEDGGCGAVAAGNVGCVGDAAAVLEGVAYEPFASVGVSVKSRSVMLIDVSCQCNTPCRL